MSKYFQLSVFLLLFSAINNVTSVLIGMIAPIEVIEEWTCHDSEIRLTCGHLDSQIAILDATFTPNCTSTGDGTTHGSTNETCKTFNEYRLIQQYILHHRYENRLHGEAEAGRRFLQELRKPHNNDAELDEEFDLETSLDYLSSGKEKRFSLRASLEKLIEQYLRKITPDRNDIDDTGYDSRKRRSSDQNVTVITGDISVNDTWDGFSGSGDDQYTEDGIHDDNEFESVLDQYDARNNDGVSEEEYTEINTEENDVVEKIELGSRTISISDTTTEENKNEKLRKKQQKIPSVCLKNKRRVSHLDKLELDHSLQNHSDTEYNIRNLLNYRCSGKNHCSFIFSSDHPLAVIWNSGVVRIKYACMDNFRINRFCNENLVIGNEIVLPNSKTGDVSNNVEEESNEIEGSSSVIEGKGEPRAEARVQLEQNYHQFTNLKIIKGTPEDEEEENRKKNERKRQRQRQGIYSQDFRLVKVLPGDSDKPIKIQETNEFYIRRDKENEIPKSIPRQPNIETNNINDDTTLGPEPTQISPEKTYLTTKAPPATSATTSDTNDILTYLSAPKAGTNNNKNMSMDYEIIIREGKEVITIYPETITKLLNSFAPPPENLTDNTIRVMSPYAKEMDAGTTEIPMWKEELMKKYPIAFDSDEEDAPENETKSDKLEEMDFIKRIKDSFDNRTDVQTSTTRPKHWDDYVENIVIPIEDTFEETHTEINEWGDPVHVDDDNEDDDDDEKDNDSDDYDYDYGSSGERLSSYRKGYSSIQRTALGKPLIQGFAMTPGYPKYYIGEMDCKWKITAPPSQKIRLTILDLALRYDDICKDYLEVIDLELNRVLFSSCKESKKPIEIISLSNQLEISVKSVSKLAYPKRGVLIHYTALGCIEPPIPSHVSLVQRTEHVLNFVCDSKYVFPDTAATSRELVCIRERHTWDKTLPNCVEQVVPEEGHHTVVSRYNQARTATSPKMTEKDADMLYDIIIPSIIIAALFIVNAVIFAIIMRYRRRRHDGNDGIAEL